MDEMFFVVDATGSIYKQGTRAECEAFITDSITAEVMAGTVLDIVSASDWMQRNVYDDAEQAAAPDREVLHTSATDADGVVLPSADEMRAFWQHERKLTAWMQSLTPEQIDKLCNAGYYNDAMRGYLIAAAKEAGMDHDQQQALLNALRYCLDTLTKADAERVCTTYCGM